MRTKKMNGKLVLATVLAAALLLLLAQGAQAAQLKITADQFTRYRNLQQDYRISYANSSTTNNPVLYYYVLPLPVGTRITGLSYKHFGITSAGDTPLTAYAVSGAKGNADPSWRNLFLAGSTADTGSLYSSVVVTGTAIPASDPIVRRGWTYFVWGGPANDSSGAGDVIVTYE